MKLVFKENMNRFRALIPRHRCLGACILLYIGSVALPSYAASTSMTQEESDFLHRLLRAASVSSEAIADSLELEASLSDVEATDGQKYLQINGLASAGAAEIIAPHGGTFPLGSAFIELRQNLWNKAFDAQTRVKKAEYNERKAASAVTKTNILRRFSLLYIEWINACQSVDIYSNQVEILEKITSFGKRRYALGDDTRLTLQQGRIRLLNAREQVKQSQVRSSSLAQRLAIEAQDKSPKEADPEEVESVFSSLLKIFPKDANYSGNEAREARLHAADANLDLLKDNFGPKLDLVGRVGATNYASNTTFQYSGKTIVPEIDLSLELTVPIYDGRTHSHAMRASLQRRNAVEERNKAELAFTREQIVDWMATQQIGASSKKTYDELARISNERTSALERQLKGGANTLFDMLNAAEDLLLVERQRAIDFQQKLQADLELAISTNRMTVDELQKLAQSMKDAHGRY